VAEQESGRPRIETDGQSAIYRLIALYYHRYNASAVPPLLRAGARPFNKQVNPRNQRACCRNSFPNKCREGFGADKNLG
jgi:hypothetical protein